MYEVGISKSFRAWHIMPGMEGPEGELHSHDYRMEVVASRRELDDRGMVCDLDVLEAALGDAVNEIDDKDLEAIRPPEAEAVTVEVLARWGHERISQALPDGEELTVSIRVWENPVAFGGYAAPARSR